MSNYRKSLAKICLPLFALILPGLALADSASERLSKIEAETLVLRAREKQLDVQAKIIARQSEIATKQMETERIALPAGSGNPSFLAVEGIGKKMYASLQIDNGNVIEVKVGDALPNGMRVMSIKTNEVIIENLKKQRVRLAPVAQAPAAFDASFPSAGLRLPPPPSAHPSGAGASK